MTVFYVSSIQNLTASPLFAFFLTKSLISLPHLKIPIAHAYGN